MLDLLYFGTSVSVTQDQTQIPPARGRVGITVTRGYMVQMIFNLQLAIIKQILPSVRKPITEEY